VRASHLVTRGAEAWRRLGGLALLRRAAREPRRILAELHSGAPDLTLRRRQYQEWLRTREVTPVRRAAMESHIGALRVRPRISLLMPVFDTEPAALREAIASVGAQIYASWELCVVDDGSTAPHVASILAESAMADPRIKRQRLPSNQGIVAASNEALALASGDYVGLLDHDDTLTPDALFEVACAIDADPALDLVYTDSDKKDVNGERIEPFRKPGWSPDLLLAMNYITHFCVFRRQRVIEAGGFRAGYDGSQDHDLLLRVTEGTDRIAHVPYPLYSWRQTAASTAADPARKPYAHEAGRRAVADALVRRGIAGAVEDGDGGPFRYRVRRTLVGTPLVSVVRRRRGGSGSLWPSRTAYPHVESISDARAAQGEYVLLLDDDLVPAEPHWLEALLEQAQRPEVGAAGAKLLAGRTLREAGLIVDAEGHAFNVFDGFPADHPGEHGLAHVIRECAAVTRCLLTRRSLLQDATSDPSADGFDLAFCADLRRAGYRILYTPYARLDVAKHSSSVA
jgi:glycosyltransferase involved in cell wall biosynthesis